MLIVLIGVAVLFLGQQYSSPVPTPSPTATPIESGQEQPSPTEAVQQTSVEIKNFAFGPKTLTVKRGTTITFTNQDSVGHTATADNGNFGTEILTKGESESVTFDKAGTYTYHCTPHPYMKATIVVE